MKILVGLMNNGYEDERDYKMFIVEVDEISKSSEFEWVDLDINQLQECSNVRVNMDKFKTITQKPEEYLEADFDVNRLIDWGRKMNDFQITNVYYDELDQPQLYRVVQSDGHRSICDISELEYRKRSSVYGKNLEELPDFVRKEPLSSAYNWWKAKDEKARKDEDEWGLTQFEVSGSMPVKLVYHYLIGVKGFKVGYHTATEITEDSEICHEYLLYKDTANIKLTESIPKEQNRYTYQQFDMFDREKDPYPIQRKLRYGGAIMSMICSTENFPEFGIHNGPSEFGTCDENGMAISIDYRNGMMQIYNKIEEAGCIQKNWRLGEDNDLFGMTKYNIIPNELALLGARLQSEKEGANYRHIESATQGHWSTYNTNGYMKAIGLALSTQYYSPDFKEQILPILNSYQNYYKKNLIFLINDLGAQDALEAMKWAKDTSKKVLNSISNVKSDGSIEKSNIDMVDQLSELFTFKRNNYDLPDWLQIYSPHTIESLGGVELLKQLVATKDKESLKTSVLLLAEWIENEKSIESNRKGEPHVKLEEIIQKNLEIFDESQGIKR